MRPTTPRAATRATAVRLRTAKQSTVTTAGTTVAVSHSRPSSKFDEEVAELLPEGRQGSAAVGDAQEGEEGGSTRRDGPDRCGRGCDIHRPVERGLLAESEACEHERADRGRRGQVDVRAARWAGRSARPRRGRSAALRRRRRTGARRPATPARPAAGLRAPAIGWFSAPPQPTYSAEQEPTAPETRKGARQDVSRPHTWCVTWQQP